LFLIPMTSFTDGSCYLLAFAWKQIKGGNKAKNKPRTNPALPPIYHIANEDEEDIGSGRNLASPTEPEIGADTSAVVMKMSTVTMQ
jgi:hypothetical protein